MQRRSCLALVAALMAVLAWVCALVSCLLVVGHLAVTLAMREPEAPCTRWHALWRHVQCDVDIAGHWRSAGWADPRPWLLGTAFLVGAAWLLGLARSRAVQPSIPPGEQGQRLLRDAPDRDAGPGQLPSPRRC